MAQNSTTGIDPAVDRFVQVSVPDLGLFDVADPATYNVTNFNAVWPRADGAALSGANPNILYFKKVDTEKPVVDHRYVLITTPTMTLADPVPAEGLPVGEYGQIHTPQKLSVEILKAQVETAFQFELRKRFPDSANPAVLLEAADAITRSQAGAALTTGEQAVLDDVTAVGDAVKQLRAKQAEFNAAIDADLDYDITDWEISE
jgi:hypothetical protein